LTVTHAAPSNYSALQGATGQILDTLLFTTPASGTGVTVDTITASNIGTALSSDVSAVKLYEDTNANGTLDIGTDIQVDSTTLVSGQIVFGNNITLPANTTNKRYFIVASLSSGAVAGRTLQTSIASAGITVLYPDTVTVTGAPIAGASLTVRDASTLNSLSSSITYGVSGNNTPQARAFDPTSSTWSSASGTTADNTANNRMINKASPIARENIVGTLTTNAGAGSRLYLKRYNGSAWSAVTIPSGTMNTAVADLATKRSFDIEYEEENAVTPGRAVAVWSIGNNMQYSVWNPSTSTWSTAANVLTTGLTANYNIEWVELVPRPGSAEISLVYMYRNGTGNTSARRLRGSVWKLNGGVDGWTNNTTDISGTNTLAHDSTTIYGDTKCFDAAYEETTGDLLVVFGTDYNLFSNPNATSYYVTRAVGTSTWNGAVAISTWTDEGTVVSLSSEPGGTRIVAAAAVSYTHLTLPTN
jgi:hypothetical protein